MSLVAFYMSRWYEAKQLDLGGCDQIGLALTLSSYTPLRHVTMAGKNES